MKQCSKCNEWKSEIEFNKAKNGKDGLSAVCKECKHKHYLAHAEEIKLKSKHYYETHKSTALMNAKNNRVKNKLVRVEFINGIKTDCVKCGENRKYIVEFHHIKPSDKKLNIGNYKVVGDALFTELSKCVCLCRNCHSEFHYFYGNNPNTPVESLTEYLGKDPYTLVPRIDERVAL